jgi:hypothetical protein
MDREETLEQAMEGLATALHELLNAVNRMSLKLDLILLHIKKQGK